MLKLFSSLSLGKGTNTEIFDNKTLYDADIVIKCSNGSNFNCKVPSMKQLKLPVTRNEIGDIRAYTIVK